MNLHFFDTDIAKEVGVVPAVIYSHIAFWVGKNRADGRHYHDGKHWTFMSIKGFSAYFPYLSQRQIENALSKLKQAKLIVTGNYNKVGYDRTLWYAITEKGESILQSGEIENTKMQNGITQNVEPIPDVHTYKNTDNNSEVDKPTPQKKFQKPTLEELENYIDEKKLDVEPERFLDYYTANGWRVGKNPMKSWQATVRNWDRRERKEREKPDSRLDFDRSQYQ